MGFEQFAHNLRSIFHRENAAHVEEHAPNYEPIPDPVSPWKVIMGDSLRDRALTAEMAESFDPHWYGVSQLHPLADAGGRWFSEPMDSPDGGKQSSIWLDPAIWQPTLDEFAHFADYFNSEISFLVRWDNSDTHPAFTQKGYISVTPVLIGRDGFGRNGDISFGISDEGRVCVGSVRTGFRDLGYLNPRRKHEHAVSGLMDTLSQPWE